MTKRRLTDQSRTAKHTWSDGKEELQLAHQLFIGLRYHIQTQHLLSSRRTKQRIIIGIAIAAVVLTLIFAIM
ncbi:hypothetical protein JHJ32_02720 [Parapedobacter sp. ISTM3]|uniref:hypothetical protein n=1 Tax=Parapedobacter sp. ISTM3 TaxID=2800130 RepID=UPI0019089740|nr:hypothetical protein [Parapedobacter sp. ISTM3]MBK1438890.1 hypothetical protein [Parapedobacter sp. ISTM3]